MLIRVDGSTVGLVSGGCLESDLAEHARRVNEKNRPEVVSYDTRDDEDAPWGLGLGCNGLIEVLLEPLDPARATEISGLLEIALGSDTPSVIATVIRNGTSEHAAPSVGAHTLFRDDAPEKIGDWGDGSLLKRASASVPEALAAGRRGLVKDYDGVEVAFEVVAPSVRFVICGSGPDALPIASFAVELGWDVTVVDHRPLTPAHGSRFPGARAVECSEPSRLADVVRLTPRTAAVVASHHFERDRDYMRALLASDVSYVGMLGPRARTERMLADLAKSKESPTAPDARLFTPVGMDIGGDGPDAIALSIIAEVSAVMSGRGGGHLRDRRGSLHV